ncbi:hypothetical protein FRC17_000432 [Serendipita sp. 399]|nr:hypothetical protein FRC17_000432 [Serendipita sp. 399]
MSKRLYVGKLPMDTRPEDLKSFFEPYGKMVDCRILTGFGFVEFDTAKDAEDVVRNFNGKTFMGSELIVEQAKESRPRRGYEDRGGSYRGGGGGGDGGYRGGGGGGRGPRAPGIRLVVTGVSRDTSWQDLKDFARQAGNVSFADIDRDVPNQGVIEFPTREEADQAIRDLDGKDIRGVSVRVYIDERRSGGGGGGGGGGYGRGGGGDRYGGGGGGYSSGRRDRSRSPRRGYDDRRRYDDRDRRREERHEDRDDRRHDDRERRERY